MYNIHQQHIFVPLRTRNIVKQWRLIFGLCLCIFNVVNAYAQSLETILQQAKKFYDENNYPLAHEKYLQALKQAEKENNFEVVLIDVTESPVERPKKNNQTIIHEKRNAIRKKHK